MEDHGQMLTDFENMFGGEIEHEVIKMILQSCKWNVEEATEKLLNLHPSGNDLGHVTELSDNSTPIFFDKEECFPRLPTVSSIPNYSLKQSYLKESKSTASLNRSEYSPNRNQLNKSQNSTKLDYVKNIINGNKEKILIIMRGLPGSGKSTLAKSIKGLSGIVLSTDDYFYDSLGNYNYDVDFISEAHNWNKNRARVCLSDGKSPIIIDNTNLQMWEFQPYVQYALDYGYFVEILEPETPWKYNIKELSRRNSHKVPSRKIEEMNCRYDKNLTIEAVVSKLRTKNNIGKKDQGIQSNIAFNKTYINRPTTNYNSTFTSPEVSAKTLSDSEPDIVIESSDSEECNSPENSITINLENNTKKTTMLSEEPKILMIDSGNLSNHQKDNGINSRNDETIDNNKENNIEVDASVENVIDIDNNDKISDELFLEIVDSFSNSVKEALKNRSSATLFSVSGKNEVNIEDYAMDKLLSKKNEHSVSITSSPKADDSVEFQNINIVDKELSNINLQTLSGGSGPSLIRNVGSFENQSLLFNIKSKMESSKGNSAQNIENWNSSDFKCLADDWDVIKADTSDFLGKVDGNRRRDLRKKGDPLKWLKDENGSKEDCGKKITEWVMSSPTMQSWENGSELKCGKTNGASTESFSYTGAIPKHFKSEQVLPLKPVMNKLSTTKLENCSQVVSSDFTLLKNNNIHDNNITVLFGDGSRFIPGNPPVMHRNEPLTKSKLLLDKSSTTDELQEVTISDEKALAKIKSLFPNISKSDLKDVLQKCNHDIDWAVNILIDGNYEMSDRSISMSNDQEDSSSSESESTKNNTPKQLQRNKNHSLMKNSDEIVNYAADKHKRIKQCTQPDYIELKKSIESNFVSSPRQDDNTRRITGKEFYKVNSLNINKLEGKTGSTNEKHNSEKVKSRESISPENESEGDSVEGAQYLTLEVDPLFASQLVNIFGSVSSLGINSNFSKEDYRVVLPLEVCHQIHKYWSATLDGNFQNEADILDRFIRDDEELARKLQDEEDADSEVAQVTDVFQRDPPQSFQEIVDLEKALEISNTKNPCTTSYSYVFCVKNLETEFSHIDPSIIASIFSENNCSYETTKNILASKYEKKNEIGLVSETYLRDFEEQNTEEDENEMYEEEFLALNNPQIYRDEAQMHYEERKKAFQKAQEANQNGMKAVAAYYAQLGNTHTIKLKEANERASKMILSAINSKNKDANTLDLHLLHVPEAIQATQNFLLERKSIVSNRKLKQLHVSIITGRGNHSIRNEPRLKPAIKYFLQKEGYNIREVHSGMLQVIVR